MRKYTAGRMVRSAAVFVLMLLLFPYIVSVFVNGAGADEKPFYVRVRTEDGAGNETVAEAAWPEYLAGILAMEMPEGCEAETAKALAVLIRTRLYRDAGSDENASVKERFLTGEELADRQGMEEARKIFETYVQAVDATDDTVLMYQDGYAWTPYFQSGSGKTRDAGEVLGTDAYPYLAVRECPADAEEAEMQEFIFNCGEIQELCRDFLVAEESGETAGKGYSAADFEILSRDSAEYVHEMRIGNTVCTGDQFRDALSLPSAAFTITAVPDDSRSVLITTTGKGHGLGMSIRTAERMAEEGKTYEEILGYFFEGADLRKDVPENGIFRY
ncbi:MAG TPA: SpoIID/LytB domain-containing protein [Candidatus Mediterraneibacter quadrami]|uniref:SpoIID/LytB domain-containing protein n=1 Tax=Candidatus Mediterraneibacter quadrami TaxID=2838684 RepID=A0A9D2U708_9FIRM|nr:SpoIID/LytB domain-containing protein [Candidatus Mediterraneibacter quadrami]